jgi:hypothetical protein
MDDKGRLFLVNDDKHRLVCLDANGAEAWTANLPGDIFEKRLDEVWDVGRRVYVTKCMVGNIYVSAWERNGSLAWEAGPLDSLVMGISEGEDDYVYVNTRNGLHQYDWDGNNTWHIEFTTPGTDLPRGTHLGPIIGTDNRVYVNDPYNSEFYIYNPDGSLYSEGVYTDYHTHYYNNDPRAACVGSDGRFYVACFTDVICFENWTDEVWRASIGEEMYLQDIVMGSNDIIYALYQTRKGIQPGGAEFHWVSLRPADGSTIVDVDIEVLEQFWAVAYGELAIGQDNKLIYLNHSGYLAVFEPLKIHFPPEITEHAGTSKTGGK